MEPKRNEFRERMNQFKLAREANPLLSYWEWKRNQKQFDSKDYNIDELPNISTPNSNVPKSLELEILDPNRYENTQSSYFKDSPYNDVRIEDRARPRFELRKEPVNYYSKTYVNILKGLGKGLRFLGPVTTLKENLFPSNEDELIENLRVKMKLSEKAATGYADGTEGIEGDSLLNDLKRNVRTELTPELKLKLELDIAKYSRMSGATRPVFDISDAVDMTPIGNAVMAKDMYDAVTGNDYITAGLIGASMVVPGVVGKQVKRYIPTVNRTVAEKINALRRNNNVVRETEWNNEINRSIERIYDSDVRDRAALIKRDYGVDIQAQYDAIHDMYTNNYESIPKAKITSFADDSRAKMTTNKEATEAWSTLKRPAQASDFEMQVRSDVEPSREITDHEINHWWTYTMMLNPEWRKSQLQKITKDFEGALNDVNPLDPNMSQYYRDWMEQNAYGINVINSMKALNIPITKDNVIKFINAKPDTSSLKRAAYQFKNTDLYYKWLLTMPLASLLGFGLIKDNNNDNSN